ncbi:ABC transporter [Streptomyces gibsoniae]|uniref:ABC transporter n=1 Tax=Streptomyces gibsoniae TaxID=3075529 RepID=A0ABU2TRF4_9ACTN|nr:ABC transporter [Streptomyces sp. DSM 41699]MDT0463470.1 ABC transporter [Streptomyces sp. DSM 41699]
MREVVVREVEEKGRAVLALVPPVWRSLPRRPLGTAAGVGLALAAVPRLVPGGTGAAPALLLLRSAAVAFALGLAFLLDDPARNVTAAVPIRRVVRTGLRTALVVPLAALCWTAALLLVPGSVRPPAGGLTVEAATLGVLALTGAVAAVRFAEEPRPGAAVARTSVAGAGLVALLAAPLPERWALFVAADSPGWAVAHQRWAVLLALTLAAGAVLLPEPLRRHRLRVLGHR